MDLNFAWSTISGSSMNTICKYVFITHYTITQFKFLNVRSLFVAIATIAAIATICYYIPTCIRTRNIYRIIIFNHYLFPNTN